MQRVLTAGTTSDEGELTSDSKARLILAAEVDIRSYEIG